MVLAAELALAAATAAYSEVTDASDCVLHAAIEFAHLRNCEHVVGVTARLPLGEHLGGRVDGLSCWSAYLLLLLQFLHIELCRVILQIANLDKRHSSVRFAIDSHCFGCFGY